MRLVQRTYLKMSPNDANSRTYQVLIVLLLCIAAVSGTGCKQLADEGNCEFFNCVENIHPCGSEGYSLSYGYKYCKKFDIFYQQFSPKGQKWINETKKCLMSSVLSVYKIWKISCEDIREFATMSYPDCYVNSGVNFYEMMAESVNWEALTQVYEWKEAVGENYDIAWNQIRDVLQHGRCVLNDSQIITNISNTLNQMNADVRDFLSKEDIQATSETDTECIQFAQDGDCRFYECFEKRFACAAFMRPSHMQNFEYPSCRDFYKSSKEAKDTSATEWVKSSQICLIQVLLPVYQGSSVSCKQLHSLMFEARFDCYINNGYCDVMESADWALERGIGTLSSFPLFGGKDRSTMLSQVFGKVMELTNYYGRDQGELRRLMGDIHCECQCRGLTTYKDLYKTVYSQTYETFMNIKN